MSKRYLYFDTETTGLDPYEHSIISLAAIVEIDGVIKGKFIEYCQPHTYSNISLKALEVNRHTIEKLKTYQTQFELFRKFITFIGQFTPKNKEEKLQLVGQNARFDKDFLTSLFYRNGFPKDKFHLFFLFHVIDLMIISSFLMDNGVTNYPNIQLGTIANFFGVPLDAHDAMADTECVYTLYKMLSKVYLKDGKDIDLNLLPEGCPAQLYLKNKYHPAL